MKKIVYIFAILFCIGLVSSCSNEDAYEFQSSAVENAQIITDLKNINSELLSTVPSSTTIRKGLAWTGKEWANVVYADATGAWGGGKIGGEIGAAVGLGLGSPITGGVFGAALGAMIGGAGASWMASPMVVVTDNPLSIEQVCRILVNDDLSINEGVVIIENPTTKIKLDVDEELIINSKLDENSLNIGKVHNLILSVMDGSVILQKEEQTSSKLKDALFDSKEFIDSCKMIAENASVGRPLSSDKMLSEVMELFNQAFEGYVSEIDDVAFIIGRYMDVIEKTDELTTEQKTCIKSGFATALYSYKYWESRFKE